MRILTIAIKDLLQILRDWKSAIFYILMPVLFTLFFGLVFPQTTVESGADTRFRIGFSAPESETRTIEALKTLLEPSEVMRPVMLEPEETTEVEKLLREGALQGVVHIPEGTGQSLAAGEIPDLELMLDGSSSVARSVQSAMQLVTGRWRTAVLSAQMAVRTLNEESPASPSYDEQEVFWQSLDIAIAAWENPDITLDILSTGQEPGEQKTAGGFTQSSPGMIVQFAIFGLISSSMILVLERKNRSLDRMLTTPTSRAEIILGHILGMFIVVFLQQFLLILMGQLLLNVNYMANPGGILLMMVCLALWSASLGLFISAISKGEDQVLMFSLLAMFVFAAMGGAWFPLEITGEAFSRIGHTLPSAWAMTGFQNIVVRGLGFSSVLVPAGILAAYALLFFLLAVWRFQKPLS